ncbi:MAG: DUF7311 family protein [Halobacteriota archaeon]
MIVRLVLAAVVAAALLGAAMPVVDDARHGVAATDADRSATAIADAITDIHRSSDPVPRGVAGAKRIVTVETADGATITVGSQSNRTASGAREKRTEPGSSENGTASGTSENRTGMDGPTDDVISYRVPSGTTGTVAVDADVRVVKNGSVRPDGEGLTLRDGQRAVLRHELVEGHPTVTVERVYPG